MAKRPMTKLVILKFNGNFQTGFQVSLDIGQEGKPVDRGFAGILPPAPELIAALTLWQQKYSRLGSNNRIKPKQVIFDGSIDPQKQLVAAAKKLQDLLQNWLNSPSFYEVDNHLAISSKFINYLGVVGIYGTHIPNWKLPLVISTLNAYQ